MRLSSAMRVSFVSLERLSHVASLSLSLGFFFGVTAPENEKWVDLFELELGGLPSCRLPNMASNSPMSALPTESIP